MGLRRFGSWDATIESAGLDRRNVRLASDRKWSKSAVLREIRRRIDCREPISSGLVQQHDSGLYNAARKLFGKGAWEKVLTLCNLDPSEVSTKCIWKRGMVQQEIKRLASLGVPLYGSNLKRMGYGPLISAGCERFGSWEKAIEAAGFDYEKVRAVRRNYWTKEKVIREIKHLEKLKVRLSLKTIMATRADLVQAAIKWFKHWDRAVEAAGINYFEHCTVWSTRAWLRKLNQAEVVRLGHRADKLARQLIHRKHKRRCK